MGLLRLVYNSELQAPSDFAGRETELIEQIRARAAEKNSANGISGVLLFNETTLQLIQVLEGDEEKVVALFKTIEQDTRHCNVKVQLQKPATDRQYGEWGMLKGSAKDWKAVKLTLPASIPGKLVGTFDEAFQETTKPTLDTASEKKKGKKWKGFLACFAA